MIPDYNLEFAHIYGNEQFGPEQARAAQRANEIMTRLSAEGKTFVTSVLIDEFNPTTNTLDEAELIVQLKVNNAPVDFIGYESRFAAVADLIIPELPPALLTLKYLDNSGKAMLTLQDGGMMVGLEERTPAPKYVGVMPVTAWTLCRLGVYPVPADAVKSLSNKKFAARKIITILPEKYRPVEERVTEIIKNLPYADRLPDIEYEFFT